jgi:hypothetical protein
MSLSRDVGFLLVLLAASVAQAQVIAPPVNALPVPALNNAPLAGSVELLPPVPSALPPLRVQSVAEFVATFKPAPQGGHYEALLLHPCTHCPVKVCFDLPCGCPRKIRCTKTGFEIRYSLCKAVVVRFLPDGTVRVRG